MLADRYQDFASHVTTLLRARRLVLNVDSCCSVLDEKLGELHDSREAAVTSVGVGYHWPQEIRICYISTIRFWNRQTFFALLAVMKELGKEQLVDLIRNGVLGRISRWPMSK